MVSDVYVSNTLLHTAYTSARRVCMHARYPSCGDGCTMAVYVSVSLQNSGEERRVAAAKRNAGVRSCARPLDQRFFPSLLFFSSSFSSSSLFFLPFIPFFRRSIDTDHLFWIIFTGVRAFPPPLPLPWQKNGNSRGPVHGFLVNFAADRRRPPMSTTRKNVLDRVTGQFLLRRRRGEKKKEACVYIYTYFIYIYMYIL